ncbi:MAG: element excision factor XisH family protein [Trichodesmium sp.]
MKFTLTWERKDFEPQNKDGRRIAVEIKTFLKPSVVSEFHTVLGQFLNYRFALHQEETERILYLAIPLPVYYSCCTRLSFPVVLFLGNIFFNYSRFPLLYSLLYNY